MRPNPHRSRCRRLALAAPLLALAAPPACGGRPLPEIPPAPDPVAGLEGWFAAWRDGRLDLLLARLEPSDRETLEEAIQRLGQRIRPHTYNTATALIGDVADLWRTRREVVLGSNAVQQGLGTLGLRPADAEPVLAAWVELLDAWVGGPTARPTGLRNETLGDLAHRLGPPLLRALRLTAEAAADSGRIPGMLPDDAARWVDLLAVGTAPDIRMAEGEAAAPPHQPGAGDGEPASPRIATVTCNGIPVRMVRGPASGHWVPEAVRDACDGLRRALMRMRRTMGRHRGHGGGFVPQVEVLQLGMLRNAVRTIGACRTPGDFDALAQGIGRELQSAFRLRDERRSFRRGRDRGEVEVDLDRDPEADDRR